MERARPTSEGGLLPRPPDTRGGSSGRPKAGRPVVAGALLGWHVCTIRALPGVSPGPAVPVPWPQSPAAKPAQQTPRASTARRPAGQRLPPRRPCLGGWLRGPAGSLRVRTAPKRESRGRRQVIGFPETRGHVCRDRLSDFTAASEMHPQPISQVWGSGDRAGDTPGGLGAAGRAATWRSRRRGPHLPTSYLGCDHTPDPGSKASAQSPQISPHPHRAGLTPCLEAHDLLLSLATCCPRRVGGRGRGRPEPSAPPSLAQSPLDPSGRAPEPPATRMKLLLPIRNALLTPRPSSRTHFPPTLAICTPPSP